MISIKSTSEINKMRVAGKIIYGTFKELEKYIAPGITTKELDRIAHDAYFDQIVAGSQCVYRFDVVVIHIHMV